eukprot:CAMPEP_0206410318 /NCGR_PEP_ID=MMETSP0294-20121207/32516_1 /ASSEMBLY_ACC=CAM_ASM_000327 /TAXON_ID=39354 /ORGANISM="Heterosigma akashiwo, Strain CCMP2393" /LENGTH=51 /DNA_ID=CAMNT_0053870631 /DNA_START=846 /DNA_END=998 /DNA_ORIENTATION=+
MGSRGLSAQTGRGDPFDPPVLPVPLPEPLQRPALGPPPCPACAAARGVGPQ